MNQLNAFLKHLLENGFTYRSNWFCVSPVGDIEHYTISHADGRISVNMICQSLPGDAGFTNYIESQAIQFDDSMQELKDITSEAAKKQLEYDCLFLYEAVAALIDNDQISKNGERSKGDTLLKDWLRELRKKAGLEDDDKLKQRFFEVVGEENWVELEEE